MRKSGFVDHDGDLLSVNNLSVHQEHSEFLHPPDAVHDELHCGCVNVQCERQKPDGGADPSRYLGEVRDDHGVLCESLAIAIAEVAQGEGTKSPNSWQDTHQRHLFFLREVARQDLQAIHEVRGARTVVMIGYVEYGCFESIGD